MQKPLHAEKPAWHVHWPAMQKSPNGQALPHAPQFCGSPCSDWQTPLHTPLPGGQKQTPPTHCSPCAHRRPQLPQWSGSDASVTQAPLQFAVGAVQLVTHWPAWHSWPAPHARPHAPQFDGSDCSETHLLLQRVKPVRQSHWPPWQRRAPGPQELPHAPQLRTSESVSAQTPLHSSWNWVHCEVQKPNVHTCPGAHAWPQPPQCCGSLPMRTQLPPHRE
jgi:hypothetical protein